MALDLLLQLKHLVLSALLRHLDKVAKLDKLLFVLRHLADTLLHVIEGGRDVLDRGSAPGVNLLAELDLDGVGLLGKALLQVLSLHLEDRVVHSVVRDVEDLVLVSMELVDGLSDLFKAGLMLLRFLFSGLLKEAVK